MGSSMALLMDASLVSYRVASIVETGKVEKGGLLGKGASQEACLAMMSLSRYLKSSEQIFQKWMKSTEGMLDVVIGNQVMVLFLLHLRLRTVTVLAVVLCMPIFSPKLWF